MTTKHYGNYDFPGNVTLSGLVGFPGLSPVASSALLGVEARGNITLAIDPSGSDTPTVDRPERLVEGDYSGHPFQTFQGAINAITDLSRYPVVINAAAGTYDGFDIRGFLGSKDGGGGQITINGLVDLAVITGPNTGTATSGTARTLTLTGAGWTADALRGMLCTITSGTGAGQSFVIGKNTTDTLTFAAKMSPAPDGTSVFRIEEQTVIINSAGANNANIFIDNCYARVAINNIKLTGPAIYKALCLHDTRVLFSRCYADGGFGGFYCYNMFQVEFNQCYSQNQTASGHGFFIGGMQLALTSSKGMCNYGSPYGCTIQGVPFVSLNGVMCLSNGYGLLGTYCGQLGITDLWVEGSTTNGVFAQADTLVHLLGDTYIANCTGNPFNLYAVQVRLGGTLTGTGNTGYGVRCAKYNATFNVDGGVTPTITGSSGDATVDDSTALVWATDLAVSGSYAHNIASGARIYRS